MYINHLTLNTGHLARTSRGDVPAEVTAVLAHWLHGLLAQVNAGAVRALDQRKARAALEGAA